MSLSSWRHLRPLGYFVSRCKCGATTSPAGSGLESGRPGSMPRRPRRELRNGAANNDREQRYT